MYWRACVLVYLSIWSAASRAQVLATAGRTTITVEEFKRRYEGIRRLSVNPPTPAQFLEDLVRLEIGAQQAEKEKLDNSIEIKERIKQMLNTALLEKHLGDRLEDIRVTENELRSYYKKSPELHLAHLLFEVKTNATVEERASVKKRALEALAESKKRPFEELVKAYSDDPSSKDADGDLGYHSRLSLPESIYDFALKMKPGEIKGPVESAFGFHILKLIEQRDFDMADKRPLRTAVVETKREKILDDYFSFLKKQYKVEINQKAFKEFE